VGGVEHLERRNDRAGGKRHDLEAPARHYLDSLGEELQVVGEGAFRRKRRLHLHLGLRGRGRGQSGGQQAGQQACFHGLLLRSGALLLPYRPPGRRYGCYFFLRALDLCAFFSCLAARASWLARF